AMKKSLVAAAVAGLKFPGFPSASDEQGKIYILDLLHPKPRPVDQVEIFHFVEENTLTQFPAVPCLSTAPVAAIVSPDSFFFFPFFFYIWTKHLMIVVSCTVSPMYIMMHQFSQLALDKKAKKYIFPICLKYFSHHSSCASFLLHVIFPHQSVAVGSLCDNIEVDHGTGDLWLGCHPNAIKFLKYDPKDPPGSKVIHIKNIHSECPLVSQEYGDDGRVITAPSVAAPYEGKLLIGTVVHRALLCDLK
uniref:Arylesterase n=1 Tax=Mola mola TaxID=94237 RepID=A0A3Q3VRC3_MOLML